MARVELVVDSHCRLGESPVSYASGDIRFVDIEGCKIYSYDTVANRSVREVGTEGKVVGHIVACASDALPGYDLLASLDTAIVPVNFEGDDCKSNPIAVIPESHLDPATKIRFNDGKVDLQGRLWAGSMAMDASRNPNSATKGYLYCLQRGTSVKATDASPSYELVQKLDQVGISNGTDWYGDRMYYIDSLKQEVCVFDFDSVEGAISNRRTVARIPKSQYGGLPDGMTVDADGKLWVAVYGGGAIVQMDPETQTELMKIEMPILCPTSMAFGGKDLSELYVTSGARGEEQKGGNSEHRGGLFRVHIPGVKGSSFSRAFTV
ncbi:hypothetical protein M758_1G026000 [Ceratodon purpureus]|nr:hypothetical protein M758_1G026000 [Ceratodon purpureus]